VFSKTSKFNACEIAFSNIKKGTFKFEKNRGKPITPALVSVEAEQDKGYLKRKRLSHSLLIKEIDDYNELITNDVNLKFKSLEALIVTKENDALSFKEKYEQSLQRELLLYRQIFEHEETIAQLKKL
jgi:hypothetical protein